MNSFQSITLSEEIIQLDYDYQQYLDKIIELSDMDWTDEISEQISQIEVLRKQTLIKISSKALVFAQLLVGEK